MAEEPVGPAARRVPGEQGSVKSRERLGPLSQASRTGASVSVTTVVVAFCANLLVAIAKSVASVVTGSASILAEAAHSWADTGNEVFLLVANRRCSG